MYVCQHNNFVSQLYSRNIYHYIFYIHFNEIIPLIIYMSETLITERVKTTHHNYYISDIIHLFCRKQCS